MTTTMQLIAKQTVGSGGAASVTFSNIPQTYTDLKIVTSARATTSDWLQSINLTFNSSRTTAQKRLYGLGSSVVADSSVGNGQGEGGYMPASTATASTFSNNEIYIPNYTGTNAKSYLNDMADENNSSTQNLVGMFAGLNSSVTTAITSITLTSSADNFAEYSTFYLYGISNSTTTQATTVPYASGGDVITTDGSYWYHAFKYSGTFTPLKNLDADILVVAGGGCGGTNWGGGGGAGGLRGLTAQPLISNTSYVCQVGAGGAGGEYVQNPGGNSVWNTTFTANGGAPGNNENGGTAASGGSGGGAGRYNYSGGGAGNTPSTSPSQGNNGGNGGSDSGGGGGGASATGANGSGGTGGTGGAGSSAYSSWGAATLTGQLVSSTYYYAGGGGGFGSGTPGTGGNGGGGNSDANATANTGGGGGAGTNSGGAGRSGGSGIIIVRYAV